MFNISLRPFVGPKFSHSLAIARPEGSGQTVTRHVEIGITVATVSYTHTMGIVGTIDLPTVKS